MRVIAVSSAVAGEGKSAATANLAAALAATGSKVLAVSADVRWPALHEYFSSERGVGVIDVLSEESTLRDAARFAPMNGDTSARAGEVTILSNRRRFADPAVLYQSNAMSKLLEQARQSYDFVLLDAPPLLQAGEASVLSQRADAVILVSRLSSLTRDQAQRAIAQLRAMGIEPVGLIVTNQDQEGDAQVYGYAPPRGMASPARTQLSPPSACTSAPPAAGSTGPAPTSRRATVAALLAVVIAAAAVGAFAPRFAPDLVPSALTPYLVVGMAGLVALTFLCLAAPVGCLVAAFALLSVVRSEPAPVDLLSVLLILTSFLTGRRPKTATPPIIAAAVGALALLSVAWMFNAIDTPRAVRFEGITLYMMVLGLWLSGVFRDHKLTRRLMKVYVLTALFSAVLGILALKAPLPGKETFLYGGDRAKALFKDPNVLSPFLVPAAP